MTVDASRSCLSLATCVRSATRQIVDARVLLTATVPPALPGRSVSDGSLAPPLDVITQVLRSAGRHRHLPSDGPDETRQLAAIAMVSRAVKPAAGDQRRRRRGERRQRHARHRRQRSNAVRRDRPGERVSRAEQFHRRAVDLGCRGGLGGRRQHPTRREWRRFCDPLRVQADRGGQPLWRDDRAGLCCAPVVILMLPTTWIDRALTAAALTITVLAAWN